MKIALAQINFFVGEFDGNLHKMLKAVEEAKHQGADLSMFSRTRHLRLPSP